MNQPTKPTTSSNKFSQPLQPDGSLLPRQKLITEILPENLTDKRFIIFEAQAGQGKTTFSSQLLNHHKQESMWYHLEQEDNDPIFFLISLHQCICHYFQDFNSPQFLNIIQEGTTSPLDIRKCTAILLNDINSFLQEAVFLVLDDFHKISTSDMTAPVLAHIFDTCPDKLHFLITTRLPIQLRCKALLNQASITYLHTEDLALKQPELQTLVQDIFKQDVSPTEISQLHDITKGWIMGVILAIHPFQNRKNKSSALLLTLQETIHSHEQLLIYFQNEILADIPPYLHIPFLKLSLLEEIPADLAILVTEDDTIESQLHQLVQNNYFLSLHKNTKSIFRFHHLFQEFLQYWGQDLLSEQTRNRIFIQEADYYITQNRIAKGLACYVKAEKFQQINETLEQEGLKLLSQNKTISIYSILKNIPKETLYQYDWLPLITGIIQGDFSPEESLPLLETATRKFRQKGDQKGELIALAQTIYYHFVVSGLYTKGAELLARAETLYQANQDLLDTNVKIMVLRNLASGHCFFNGDLVRAKSCATLANRMAGRRNLKNFIASTSFILGYTDLLSGNFKSFLQNAETCFSLMNDPLVGTSNKLTIRILHLCYLSMTGDFINFEIQKESLLSTIHFEVTKQTVAAPYLNLWTGILAISAGIIEDALDHFASGKNISSTAQAEHMASQTLQWQAYSHTLLQSDTSRATPLLEQAAKLREIAGGPFYTCVNLMIHGCTLTAMQKAEQALEKLTQGKELAEQHDFIYLKAAILFHRADSFIQLQHLEKAQTDLGLAITLLDQMDYTHFWSIPPSMWNRLHLFCKKQNIVPEFNSFLELEKNRTFSLSSNKQLPLLEITVLDGFSIKVNGKIKLTSMDLTQQQRQLLGILISARGQYAPIESILLQLWPDGAPDKVRKNFDALMERLRRTLSSHLAVPIKHYIVLSKGILSLINTNLDTTSFLHHTREGLKKAKINKWWQAGNHFNKALFLWRKTLPTAHFSGEQIGDLEDEIVDNLKTIAEHWGGYLLQHNLLEEAIEILERIWPTNTTDEDLTSMLYQAYHKKNNRQKCWTIHNRYREALTKYGHSDREITELCNNLITQNIT